MIRYVLLVSVAFYLISCSIEDEPRWMEKEFERKIMVQALIQALSDESLKERANYLELRDTFVRKRDIPKLKEIIERTNNPNIKRSLEELISYMNLRWRLPGGGWTDSSGECYLSYTEELRRLGFISNTSFRYDPYPKKIPTHLDILHSSEVSNVEKINGAVDLILVLEPDSLSLDGDIWVNVDFLKIHPILEKLELHFTSVNDLTPLEGMPSLNQLELIAGEEMAELPDMKGLDLKQLNIQYAELADLKPLQGLVGIREFYLRDTTVTDLSALKELADLRLILLENVPVSDLTPLEELQNLETLYILNTKVTDLTPLKTLSGLRFLEIKNTPVSDLSPLKELENLETLYIKNTNVTDSSPLKQLQNLRESYIDLEGAQN